MAVFCASLFFEKENATLAEGEHPIGLASGGLYESRSRHGGGKRGEELSWQRIGEPPGDGHRHLPFVFDKCRWPKKPEGTVAGVDSRRNRRKHDLRLL